jgi:hypothetical protein
MERADPETSVQGDRLFVKLDEPRSGLLGSLGVKRRLRVRAHVCPECGLVRLYVDPDEGEP